jgi:hypothetical protein
MSRPGTSYVEVRGILELLKSIFRLKYISFNCAPERRFALLANLQYIIPEQWAGVALGAVF